LLGGEETDVDSFSELASAVQGTEVNLGGLVKQVIDEQKALKNEKKSAMYLVTTLARVSKMLIAIQMDGLNENTNITGAKAQIDSIKASIDTIEKWLENK